MNRAIIYNCRIFLCSSVRLFQLKCCDAKVCSYPDLIFSWVKLVLTFSLWLLRNFQALYRWMNVVFYDLFFQEKAWSAYLKRDRKYNCYFTKSIRRNVKKWTDVFFRVFRSPNASFDALTASFIHFQNTLTPFWQWELRNFVISHVLNFAPKLGSNLSPMILR